jgi:tetratricopeptide (TPR) repeat protein
LAAKNTQPTDSNRFRILLNWGINLRRVNSLSESIEHLRKAIELQPGAPQAHNNLGLSYYEQNDPEEAAVHFTKAIQIETNNLSTKEGGSKEYLSLYLNNRGLAYYHQGMYEEAEKDYDAAIQAINGTNAENFFNRGNVFLNQQLYEQAHEDFDTAISLDKSSAKLHHAKGLAFQSEADMLAKKGQDLER